MNLSPLPRLAGLLALVALCLFTIRNVAVASATPSGGTPAGGTPQKTIEPGSSHSNGVATVTNASDSHGNARMTPWDHGDNDTTNEVTTGQQFMGRVESTSTHNTLTLGSHSGTQGTPVAVNEPGGNITMGSDTWATVHNTGSGTITAHDVSGNILGVWGPGQQSTIHHP